MRTKYPTVLRCPDCAQSYYLSPSLTLNQGLYSTRCRGCDQHVQWDLSHINAVPATPPFGRDAIPTRCKELPWGEDAPFRFTRDPDDPAMSVLDGRADAWPGARGLVVVFDERDALLHLGRYKDGALRTGLYLHQRSAYGYFVSPSLTQIYKRGAIRSYEEYAIFGDDGFQYFARTYESWCARHIAALLGVPAPPPAQTARIKNKKRKRKKPKKKKKNRAQGR